MINQVVSLEENLKRYGEQTMLDKAMLLIGLFFVRFCGPYNSKTEENRVIQNLFWSRYSTSQAFLGFCNKH